MRLVLVALSCIAAGVFLASPASSQAPTMDALWPNEDGRSWTYDLHFESYGVAPQVLDKQVRIFLDGTTVAPVAVGAQYLRQETLGPPGPLTSLAARIPDPLLRQVWVARPDLRAKIEQAVAANPCPENAPADRYALLLGGEFAYLKTGTEIAAWRCNLADTRSWLWLVSDLTIGSTFTLQLIPDLASDIFLHGTFAAVEPTTVPGGTFGGCVRVDYVIDYGTSQCADTNGNVTGMVRSETRGFVRYAPHTGPVESSEVFVVTEVAGTCAAAGEVGQPQSLTTLRLSQPPVPVQPTTWGRLKAAYR